MDLRLGEEQVVQLLHQAHERTRRASKSNERANRRIDACRTGRVRASQACAMDAGRRGAWRAWEWFLRRGSSQASSSTSLESAFESLLQRAKQKAPSEGTKRRAPPLNKATKEQLNEALLAFQRSGWAADQAIAIYVNAQLFPKATGKFRKFLLRHADAALARAIASYEASSDARALERALFPLFARYAVAEYASDIASYRALVQRADLRKPHGWYAEARRMDRRIVYHAGPTNSGKTYHALQAMQRAETGVYCGPLRLLAMEVYDTCNQKGTYCDLVTGQERKQVPFAKHVSCTIEMANVSKQVEVAVVDEIQMIADESRGWAWTRALCGLPAKELHLCGDPSALPLVRELVKVMGDELEERTYDRFTTLKVEPRSLQGNMANVQKGDAVVAFSRKDIFEIKQRIERESKEKCCVVYGALPPETRRQQAHLFNDKNSEYGVLVASDAIGMGLNLNIRRVVLSTLEKFHGKERGPLPSSMVKQIAGRAGRRGSDFPEGLVTTMEQSDHAQLREKLMEPLPPIAAAGLFPTFEQIELFAGSLPDLPFHRLITRFAEESRLDGIYFFCRHDPLVQLAKQLERIEGLSLRDRYNLVVAPVNTRDPLIMREFIRYAETFAAGKPVVPALDVDTTTAPSSEKELARLEGMHQLMSLYLWLSYRFDEGAFPKREEASLVADSIIALVEKGLSHISNRRRRRRSVLARAPAPASQQTTRKSRPFYARRKEVVAA